MARCWRGSSAADPAGLLKVGATEGLGTLLLARPLAQLTLRYSLQRLQGAVVLAQQLRFCGRSAKNGGVTPKRYSFLKFTPVKIAAHA
jgi:hypothetical protein